MTDRSGNDIQLTDNIDYFTLFVDPKFVPDKQRIIDLLTPILYDHFCVTYGVETVSQQECIQHLESFTRQDLLPTQPGQFVSSGEYLFYVASGDYTAQIQEVVDNFTSERAIALIKQRLDQLIQVGIKELNYLGFTEDEDALTALSALPYIVIEGEHFVYIRPAAIQNKDQEAARLAQLLTPYEFDVTLDKLKALVRPQENRYVKITDTLNAKLADRILRAKREALDTYQSLSAVEQAKLKMPLLHGVGLENYQERYYPHGNFAPHILGYVDKDWKGKYGIEEYYDELLAGKDGKIIGLATPWIGEVGANSFVIEKSVDGTDIYLTIDPIIQKEIEVIARYYQYSFIADSVAVTVLDPRTGKVKALVNAPDFDPNRIGDEYKLVPLGADEQRLAENLTFIDIPLYYLSGDKMVQAIVKERNLPSVKKYYFENYLWPQVFLDKNITLAYEPWSIMKAITMAIALDSDAIGMYDYYNDPGEVKVGEYTISNVSSKCMGDHTFLHALEFSCNVGMIRVAQKLSKYVFYNYLGRIWFGKKTGIELAGEEAGMLPDFNSVSVAQFFNNVYGQGILATPLQMTMAYASLINGGSVYKPTIVDKIVHHDGSVEKIMPELTAEVFAAQTSELMKTALESVLSNGVSHALYKPGYTLGGKTGTAQIAFRGKYQNGAGWTNGSVMGLITAQHPQYIIAIQVRRPRSSLRWEDTAGKNFSRIADFLISYDRIEK